MRALVVDVVSERERRLGMIAVRAGGRAAAYRLAADQSPRATELPHDDHGYDSSVDLVKRRLHQLGLPAVRPAQRDGLPAGGR
jgi:hypothetical protein